MRIICFFAILFSCIFPGFSAAGASIIIIDDLNCMMCRRYPGLSRVDENGYLGLYLADSDHYFHAVHTKALIQTFDMDGRFTGFLKDSKGEKFELGSITHIRVRKSMLAAVDAFNKAVYVNVLKEQR